MNHMNVVELAPRVAPTRDLVNAAVPVEVMEPCIGVSLQGSLEILQVIPRMLAFAIL